MPKFSNQRGAAPLLLLVVVIGVIGFIIASYILPSRSNLFSTLFPKPASHAATAKLFGVNMAAAEFADTNLPGTLNQTYTYPSNNTSYAYFKNKGLTLIRIPFLWERLLDSNNNLRQADVTALTQALDAANANGQKVILDMHNYARYNHTALTRADAPKLATAWQKIANQFKSHPAIWGYEIMNEPHDLPEGDASWKDIAQATVTSIRAVDTNTNILIPGNSWQSADRWPSASDVLKDITDPSNKIIYAAHQYFDADASGQDGAACVDDQIGVTRVTNFTNWLAANNKKGILTEYGANSQQTCLNALDNFLAKLNSDDNIVGGTYWAAGPWWGGYQFSVEPNNNLQQMAVLAKYPSISGSVSAPPGNGTYLYGVLQANNDPTRMSDEYSKGVRLVTLEPGWNLYEPSDGQFSSAYRQQLADKLTKIRAANLKVVLEPGYQYTPSWVHSYPNTRYVNQSGSQFTNTNSASGEFDANSVFNQKVRDLQERYLRQLMVDLFKSPSEGGFSDLLYAIRLGGGMYGEFGYPKVDYAGNNNSYWGFDPIAMGQAGGIATGVTTNPVPNWRPGQASPNGEARTFINWYLDSIKNYHNWQISTARKYFAGKLFMMYPSWGVRPGQLDGAIADNLGRNTPVQQNGEVQRGFDFERMINAITDTNVVVYSTWLDASLNNQPLGNDAGTDQASWTPIKFIATLGKNKGLSAMGENTGNNNLTIMQRSFQMMKDNNLLGIFWFSEPQLYGGTHASIADYTNLISQNGGPGEPVITAPVTAPTLAPSTQPSASSTAQPSSVGGFGYVSVQAESGTLTNLVSLRTDDLTAKGGQYIQFGDLSVAAATPPAGSSSVVYGDSLASPFQDWSWGKGSIDLSATTNPYSGNHIAFGINNQSFGLNLHATTAVNASPYGVVRFAARTSQTGANYALRLVDGASTVIEVPLANYGGEPTTSWKLYQIPLSAFGSIDKQNITDVTIKNAGGNATGTTLYIDSLEFGNTSTPTPTPTSTAAPQAPTPTPTPTPTAVPSTASLSLQVTTPQTVGAQFGVKVMARTDTDAANLFVAKLQFDPSKIQVTSISPTNSFVIQWVEQIYDNTNGTISIIGGVPSPGYKTTGAASLLATVNFQAVGSGTPSLNFINTSAVYRNSDNINILQSSTGANLVINPGATPTPTASPTPSPTPSASPIACTIDSANWNPTTPTKAGNMVNLQVVTSAGCIGQTLSFDVVKDGILFGLGSSQAANIPSPVTITSTNVSTVWLAEYTPNGLFGFFDPPQYYFTATVGSSALKSGTNLSVSKTTTAAKGDGNEDGVIDLVDLSILLSHYNKTTNFPRVIDINDDVIVNAFDFSSMISILKSANVIK